MENSPPYFFRSSAPQFLLSLHRRPELALLLVQELDGFLQSAVSSAIMLRLIAKACCGSHYNASARFDHCESAVHRFVPRVLCKRHDADRFSSRAEQEVLQLADSRLDFFTLLHRLHKRTFSYIPCFCVDLILPTLLVLSHPPQVVDPPEVLGLHWLCLPQCALLFQSAASGQGVGSTSRGQVGGCSHGGMHHLLQLCVACCSECVVREKCFLAAKTRVINSFCRTEPLAVAPPRSHLHQHFLRHMRVAKLCHTPFSCHTCAAHC